ncbi:LPXTG cell wall anchor domain-containing protein [Aeromicrobium stalagmiti]|uniref:LPXTG cell wall anchor domain-containing protein n=1 Tax=Aeromicrobium stalagmiti TaxID=2738988 RepID=UPI00156997D3|nr:LPXTG cell wall anchor domain-containing protein [Aeromicrobium stalagmiti]NRQ49296.1 LPXTG cell wall anchor domain-containing protein [Aeromicrobium stalagmiti]
MNALRTTAAAWLAGGILLAASGAAHAYPDGALSIDVDGSVCSNASVPVTVDAAGQDADFAVSFNGQTKTGSDGSTFSTTVTAPKVTSTKSVTLSATATYSDGTSNQTLSASAVVKVRDCADDDLAADDDDNGALPNTGGANIWWLVLGAGLVVAGGGAVATRRANA